MCVQWQLSFDYCFVIAGERARSCNRKCLIFLCFGFRRWLIIECDEEKMSPRHCRRRSIATVRWLAVAIIVVSNEWTQCDSVDLVCCALCICLYSCFFVDRPVRIVCVCVCFVFFRLQSNLNHNKFQLVNGYDKSSFDLVWFIFVHKTRAGVSLTDKHQPCLGGVERTLRHRGRKGRKEVKIGIEMSFVFWELFLKKKMTYTNREDHFPPDLLILLSLALLLATFTCEHLWNAERKDVILLFLWVSDIHKMNGRERERAIASSENLCPTLNL